MPAPLDRPTALAFALVLIAAIAIYLPRLGTPFFASDFVMLDPARGGPLAGLGGSPATLRTMGLALFLALLALLFAVARRLAGPRAAVIATAIVAVHYAAEIPVSWVSGTRETLAVALALGGLLFYLRGWKWPAAAVLALAPLAWATTLVAPLIAVVADRSPHESLRRALLRAWPLGFTVLPWIVMRVLSPATPPASDLVQGFGSVAQGLLAAIVHLPQVVAGFEWRRDTTLDFGRAIPGWLSVVFVVAAVFIAVRRRGQASETDAGGKGRAIATGIAWAVIAALPAAGAAAYWSAHQYLFAVCGAALALGAWLARRAPVEAMLAVALLGLGSASARGLGEFAGASTPWTGRSHVNRYYLDRATAQSERYLAALRRARPSLSPRATLYFEGIPPVVGFQTGDGPLIRWAYRDTTLQSYRVDQFSGARAAHGPVLLFLASGDSVVEVPENADPFRLIAISLVLAERPEQGREALASGRERGATSASNDYLLAWTEWQLGRRDRASALFEALGLRPNDDDAPDRAAVVEALAAGDTLLALERAHAGAALSTLDPERHGLLADLLLMRDPDDPEGVIEAWAARVLAPENAVAWRRWAMIQIRRERQPEALASLERYTKLSGADGASDPEVVMWTSRMRAAMPGVLANRREPAP